MKNSSFQLFSYGASEYLFGGLGMGSFSYMWQPLTTIVKDVRLDELAIPSVSRALYSCVNIMKPVILFLSSR